MCTRITALFIVLLMAMLPASIAAAQAAPAQEADAQQSEGPGPIENTDDAELAMLAAINQSRAEKGLDALVENLELRDIARGWTDHLVDSQDLAHNPTYAEEYTGHWRLLGENVGYTSFIGGSWEATVAHLHQAFLNSPGHLANIVGDYNQAAVGVRMDDSNKMWVTVNFLNGNIPVGEEVLVNESAPEETSVEETLGAAEQAPVDEPVEEPQDRAAQEQAAQEQAEQEQAEQDRRDANRPRYFSRSS